MAEKGGSCLFLMHEKNDNCNKKMEVSEKNLTKYLENL